MKKLFCLLAIQGCLLTPLWAQPEIEGPDDFGTEIGLERPPGAAPGEHPMGPPPGGFGPERVFRFERRMGPGPANDEQVLRFLQQNYPERASQLQEMKASKPDEYRRQFHAIARRVGPLTRMQQQDPGAFAAALSEFKVDDKVVMLLQSYAQASEGQKSALKSQLKPLLEQQFLARQGRERKRLAKIKEEAARLESRLQQRDSQQQAIVERHLDDLTSDRALRW